ncbi:MAG: DNA mismatch repair endonuclease MutL [Bdellovibrionota bacterium]
MHDRRPIQVLSDQTIRKIAAGEVIERPYSIVKELLENAVDALATTIEVSVIEGGMQQITVKDDGIGFTTSDLPLSVVKNATSKILSEEDLQHISTNGFRGEALSSISSVSKFEIITKNNDANQGYSLCSEGGSTPTIKPAAANEGTMIVVKDLFFNVPARKKFLKSKNTEYTHIEKAFKKIALAHPEIHFVLKRDGKTMLNLGQTSDYQSRIAQLYAKDLTQSLVTFEGEQGPITVFGYAANQQSQASRPSEIWIFVNGRWVSDRALSKAIMEGYRSALMEHKFPAVFLYIQMPPAMFDINVHPTKSEIRFQDPQILFRMVQRAIADKLKGSIANHRLDFQPKTFHPQTYSFAPSTQELKKVQSQTSIATPPSVFTKNIPQEPTTEPIGYFSALTFLSVLDGTYIICKNQHELVLIDQHAAHERILFEKLSLQWKKQKNLAQKSLMPMTLELNGAQLEAFAQIDRYLKDLGLDCEPFGDHDIVIRSVPNFLPEHHVQDFLFSLLQQVQEGQIPSHADDLMDHLLSTTACHSAIRAHDRLEVSEIQHLLTEMDQVDHASYCPHGRPSFIKMDLADLEKVFKRKI